MYRCYTGAQIRAAEQPRLAAGDARVLIGTAAGGLAQQSLDCVRQRGRMYGSHVLGLVGKGNSGGDTLWALSFLASRGVALTAIALNAAPENLQPDGRAAFV